ncbi:hypothetical protein E2F50_22395 [Rhizobium deserti]|uniref:Uncharacterized protein n=1 Tax=Rhizobium deserti TaxID=2547961 RepID=A0A4V3AN61_9HYPH|nr:hypothetical protein [Rhizobium deserti]TDK29593.1 hypothetical protein E2F50_22395 [Rhizobium deserti]
MDNTPLARLMTDAPQLVPLYLARFRVEVDFKPAYADMEDRSVVEEAFEELTDLLKAGFFAWRYMEARAQAHVAVEWREGGFAVFGGGAGLHHNLLVVVLRMIVALHHTPLAAREELVAVLGDDADALPPPLHWSDAVAVIRLADFEGVGDESVVREQFDDFIIDAETVVPFGLDADCYGDRLVVRSGSSTAFGKRGFSKLEDRFLRVCATGGFQALALLDEGVHDAELFLRAGDAGLELVVDDYRGDVYGLVELANALTRGGNAKLTVEVE